ncbi:MAG: YdcF family protein [Rickettsiales bacterium]|nr:YdcF family protein [Rickettsiales bacterium]
MTRYSRLIFSFVFLLALWAIGLFGFITEIPGQPQTNLAKTDAVVVLTGGDQRLQRGLELLNAGLADKLLVSGVAKGTTLKKLLAQYPQTDLENISQLENAIILDHRANDTFSNAIETRRWMEQEGFRSMRVVTGNYHLPRSLLIFVYYMPDYLMIPEPVFPRDFKRVQWWSAPNSIRLVVMEYNKYLLTWLRFQLGML